MKKAKHFFLFFLIFFVYSCSGKPDTVKPVETFEPETAFKKANELLEKKDYEEARSAFLEIKNRETSRKFAPLAQLKIAESYVKENEARSLPLLSSGSSLRSIRTTNMLYMPNTRLLPSTSIR